MYIHELQTFTPNTIEKMVASFKETTSQEPMKTLEPFGLPLSGQFVNGSPKPTSQGEVQTSYVMQMLEGDGHVCKKCRTTIGPQMRNPTTSHNIWAHRELTSLRKSKWVQK
jgi:hypothetical protein